MTTNEADCPTFLLDNDEQGCTEESYKSLSMPRTTSKIATTTRTRTTTTLTLDQIIKDRFEACRRQENNNRILRTDPLASDVQRRRIPGKLGLVAEYEPNLFAKKRPATISSHVPIDEPFNPNKFNFNRVSQDEILVRIQFGPSDNNHGKNGDCQNYDEDKNRDDDKDDNNNDDNVDNDNRHAILVNVSPLMFGHGLLIPWAKRCLPQRLTPQAVGLAITFLRRSAGCEFCIGFNSLGAFSSVNHLHLHILYPNELDHEARGAPVFPPHLKGFPIVHAPVLKSLITEEQSSSSLSCQTTATTTTTTGGGDGGITCRIDLLDWMVPCLSFRPFSCIPAVNNNNRNINNNQKVNVSIDPVTGLRDAVSAFVSHLHQEGIPHNVLFLHDDDDNNKNNKEHTAPPHHCYSLRVIVIPRQPQHHFNATSAGFNAALGELSGLLIAKTQEHFDDFNSESGIIEVLRRDVACSDSVMKDLCCKLLQS